jgi:hypothetical protein
MIDIILIPKLIIGDNLLFFNRYLVNFLLLLTILAKYFASMIAKNRFHEKRALPRRAKGLLGDVSRQASNRMTMRFFAARCRKSESYETAYAVRASNALEQQSEI